MGESRFADTPGRVELVAYTRRLEATIENVKGDLYLWRIGEVDAETAMHGIRDTLNPTVQGSVVGGDTNTKGH